MKPGDKVEYYGEIYEFVRLSDAQGLMVLRDGNCWGYDEYFTAPIEFVQPVL